MRGGGCWHGYTRVNGYTTAMRLWSLHPKYLDTKGLVALWREGLLAQKVLQGETRGYRHHPQLQRFRNSPQPLALIATYLAEVLAEAQRRDYHFDAGKIATLRSDDKIALTRGQLEYERQHLLRKLMMRDLDRFKRLEHEVLAPHPLFELVEGEVEPWEVV